ncbi:MAG: hypothetical protein HYZ49_19945 [Chloroflexi bacterium]|nr:hypothetical protein [Chloroflexota bacterium]
MLATSEPDDLPFNTGQKVRVIEGSFRDFIGIVFEVEREHAKLRIKVSLFGRELVLKLDFSQIEKV